MYLGKHIRIFLPPQFKKNIPYFENMYIVIYKNITQCPSNLCVTQHELIDKKNK